VLKIKNILYLGFVLWLASCSGDDITTGNSHDDYDPVGTPILFSVGLQDKAITRTDPTSMANGSRFVCTMYYHPHKNDNNSSPFVPTEEKIAKAWLEVSDVAGNAAYKNEAFSAAGTSFYWQNRLNHAFVAIANNNDLTTTTSQAIYKSPSDAAYNTYDLTNKGEKTAITQQPDPIRAKEIKAPSDNTPANNSVTLNFQHQFSLVQVNLKNAAGNTTAITTDQITKVELLGVSTKGYVYTMLNGEGSIDATRGNDINLDDYTDEQLATNKWGTSFVMFKMGEAADGYLKSFNAIAFGHLRAIRVTWSTHTATFEITEAAQRDLASGKKYVYNLEISNTTPAAARGQVVDRALSEQVRLADVTITNWPLNIE